MKTWKAERESALPIDDTWYQGSTIEKISAAAAPPVRRDSGGSSRRVPAKLTGRRSPPIGRACASINTSASASPIMRSWPWNASFQCSGGHLRIHSRSSLTASAGSHSSSSSTSSGSASKRQGYASALPGLPGQTFARSSNIGPVSRIAAANAITRVR